MTSPFVETRPPGAVWKKRTVPRPDAEDGDAGASSPLHRAAALGDIRRIESLLASDLGVDVRAEPFGATALHFAALSGRANAVEVLVRRGADLDARDETGTTPLHDAGILGKSETIGILARRGADLDARDEKGKTPLHDAARFGSPKGIERLAALGADLGARDDRGDTALHYAPTGAGPRAIGVFVAAGGEIDAKDSNGRTPLHGAAFGALGRFGNLEEAGIRAIHLCGRLLGRLGDEASADDRPTDSFARIVEVLLASGADIHARNAHGDTPMHAAVYRNAQSSEMIEALVAEGAEVGARDNDGRTPLHRATVHASRKTGPSVIRALLRAGADSDARDGTGCTPLHEAAWQSPVPVVAALLAAGPDPEARDDLGRTPLHQAAHLAARNTGPGVIRALLAAGATIEARDDAGSTPLHLAAEWTRDPAVVEALLAVGADPDARNLDGQRPSGLARRNESLRGSDLLRTPGDADDGGVEFDSVPAGDRQSTIALLRHKIRTRQAAPGFRLDPDRTKRPP